MRPRRNQNPYPIPLPTRPIPTMKVSLFAAFALMAAPFLQAQEEPTMLLTRVVINLDDRGRVDTRDVWLRAATPTAIGYTFNQGDAVDQMERKSMAEVDSLFIYDPKDYLDALDLFEGRKYAQARQAFAKVKEKYKPFAGVENNPSTMAGFHELECLRKLMDLDGLRLALQTYQKDALTLKTPLTQIEIYLLWDAVRAKTYEKALELAAKYDETRLPGNQRAQVAYCRGRALEGLDRPYQEVLQAYQTAIVADAGASEVVTRDAALRSLEILHRDQELKDAIKAYEASDGEDLIKGYTKVLEGAGLASMFELQLGAGEPLPGKYRYLLKYKQNREEGGEEERKEEPEAKETPKESDKKDGDKKPE